MIGDAGSLNRSHASPGDSSIAPEIRCEYPGFSTEYDNSVIGGSELDIEKLLQQLIKELEVLLVLGIEIWEI